MFVRQSTYDKAIEDRNNEQWLAIKWKVKYQSLEARWTELVEQINDKGGRDFLLHGKIDRNAPKTIHQFNDDELRSLLQLVHPDKHGGKQSAVVMTQKINGLRNK
jgi:hypothetical protein